MRLTSRLLDQLKSTMPEPMVSKLFMQMATDMAEDYSAQMQGMSMEERLDLAKTLMTEEGFKCGMGEDRKPVSDPRDHLSYLQIGQNHPEVCTVDQALISKNAGGPGGEGLLHPERRRALHLPGAGGGGKMTAEQGPHQPDPTGTSTKPTRT